jgi:hypothetical protein
MRLWEINKKADKSVGHSCLSNGHSWRITQEKYIFHQSFFICHLSLFIETGSPNE